MTDFILSNAYLAKNQFEVLCQLFVHKIVFMDGASAFTLISTYYLPVLIESGIVCCEYLDEFFLLYNDLSQGPESQD